MTEAGHFQCYDFPMHPKMHLEKSHSTLCISRKNMPMKIYKTCHNASSCIELSLLIVPNSISQYCNTYHIQFITIIQNDHYSMLNSILYRYYCNENWMKKVVNSPLCTGFIFYKQYFISILYSCSRFLYCNTLYL